MVKLTFEKSRFLLQLKTFDEVKTCANFCNIKY